MRRAGILVVALGGLLAAGLTPVATQGQAPTKNTWQGVFTAEQAKRGGDLYMGVCSSCHGPQMGGIDAAPGLNGGSFYANWNGVALSIMMERVRVSMPQNSPGTLGRQQIVDIMAYVFSRNGMPAGAKELPRQTAYLQDIAFVAQKPR